MTDRDTQAAADGPCRDRRRVLKILAGVAGSIGALGAPFRPALAAALPPVRAFSVHALRTGERLSAVFFRDGRYDPGALMEIDHVLRDWRTGDVHEIDRRLLDLLSVLRGRLGNPEPFELISGYRSPSTNEALAANNSGVARRSLHMSGMAADFRLPGCDLATLHQAAVEFRAGGVGLYSRPDFVHVDTGEIRYWGG